MNNAMVLDIKIRLRDGPTEGWSRTDLIKLLADEFDVTEGLIRHIDMGRAWTHVSTL